MVLRCLRSARNVHFVPGQSLRLEGTASFQLTSNRAIEPKAKTEIENCIDTLAAKVMFPSIIEVFVK